MVMSFKDVVSSNLRFAYSRWTSKKSQSWGQVVDHQEKQIAASRGNYANVALGVLPPNSRRGMTVHCTYDEQQESSGVYSKTANAYSL